MPRRRKTESLKANGTLNPHAQRVDDPLFQTEDFFDPEDLLQVKYEMLRRLQTERWSVTEAAENFGFSRPSFYKANTAFAEHGLVGLLGHKRGPKRAHKLSGPVMRFVAELKTSEPALPLSEITERIRAHFGIQVHVRSLQRALGRQEKKRRPEP